MQESKGNLFTRDDTFFGVCEGLGEDLRIPSNLFRIAFALLLFVDIFLAIKVYLGLGVLVLASRLLFPRPRVRPAARKAPAPVVVETVRAAPACATHAAPQPEELAAAA